MPRDAVSMWEPDPVSRSSTPYRERIRPQRDSEGHRVDAGGRRIDVMGRPVDTDGRSVRVERPAPGRPADGSSEGQRRQLSSAGVPPRSSTWRRFTRRYGWRAYALPLLVVVTVVALATTGTHSSRKGPSSSSDAVGANAVSPSVNSNQPKVAASNEQLKADDPGASANVGQLQPLQLPAGPAFTKQGKGTFGTIPGHSAVIGRGVVHKFSIEVENGITGVDLNQFAGTVMSALSNSQSWIASGDIALQRVDSGPVDFHISLTSQMTVRSLCGYDLPVETSCYDDSDSRVVLNVARWVRGARAYASDLATYRLYAVNHEVGHALGHNHSHECLPNGLAPVMMQQTIGLKTADGTICQPNPWPYPKGVAATPGPEEPGDQPDLDFYRRNST
jgi:Protein of unknown function (DUF3152)